MTCYLSKLNVIRDCRLTTRKIRLPKVDHPEFEVRRTRMNVKNLSRPNLDIDLEYHNIIHH